MMTFSNRTVVHLDIDAFFASVEQRDDAKLRGRPVAVGTGVVASCSYEARRDGVSTGMRLAEARHRCRDLIVLPGAYPRYEQAARQVLAICAERTPVVEVAALDDLYLDLTGCVEGGARSVESGARNSPLSAPHSPRSTLPTPLSTLAADLREAVRDETRLSVSLGSGANKLVARVATNAAKPGKHVHVPAGGEVEYLAPWPARVLPGVGSQTAARLDRLNVQHVRAVAGMPEPLLARMFGPKKGPVLHAQAHGIDPRPVRPLRPQQSVGRRASFDPPVADRAFLAAMVGYLVERACSWLRFHRQAARGVTVTIRYGDYESASGRELFRQPTDRDEEVQEAARDRFERLYQRRLPLRFLGVELAPLESAQPPPALFADPDDDRARRLLEVKDEVRRRFGFTSLLSGAALTLAGQLERDRENFRFRTPCLAR